MAWVAGARDCGGSDEWWAWVSAIVPSSGEGDMVYRIGCAPWSQLAHYMIIRGGCGNLYDTSPRASARNLPNIPSASKERGHRIRC